MKTLGINKVNTYTYTDVPNTLVHKKRWAVAYDATDANGGARSDGNNARKICLEYMSVDHYVLGYSACRLIRTITSAMVVIL